MQAAFVDIGLEKAAFLHASDIVPHTECVAENEKQQFQVRDISELVRQGQDLVVQVVKDPLGTKGARLTTDVTLPSRYLVFMPGAGHVGVSQRIESENERERLKKMVSKHCDDLGGFIIRTAAEGATPEELAQDAAFLKHLWRKVLERRAKHKPKSMLYGELGLAQRILRGILSVLSWTVFKVDSRIGFENLKEFTDEFVPELSEKLDYYAGEQLYLIYTTQKVKFSARWIARLS